MLLHACTLHLITLLQELNELQAYILVRRWSAKQAEPPLQLSSDQLHDLEMEYYLQRTYLLRSIEELLTQSGTKEYALRTARAVEEALGVDLEAHLIQALSISLSHRPWGNSASSATQPGSALVPVPSANSSDAYSQQRHSLHAQQQLASEQELLLSLTLSLYSMWRQSAIKPFQKLMQVLDGSVLKAASVLGPVSRTACLVSSACITAFAFA